MRFAPLAALLTLSLAVLPACRASKGTLDGPALVRRQAALTPFEGVLSHKGQPRTLDALEGHPTVVWFFPMAGTPG